MANDSTATKMKLPKTIIFLIVGMEIIKASPLPIDPMWKSESFIKAYTASYGIDSRIEPNLDAEEKKVLVSVAEKMGNKDRLGAIALIILPYFISSRFYIDVLTLIFFTAYLGQSWNILGGDAGHVSYTQMPLQTLDLVYISVVAV